MYKLFASIYVHIHEYVYSYFIFFLMFFYRKDIYGFLVDQVFNDGV